jgi:hypothetical protein
MIDKWGSAKICAVVVGKADGNNRVAIKYLLPVLLIGLSVFEPIQTISRTSTKWSDAFLFMVMANFKFTFLQRTLQRRIL